MKLVFNFDPSLLKLSTKRSTTDIRPPKHQRRQDYLEYTTTNSHAGILAGSMETMPVTSNLPSKQRSGSEFTSDDWLPCLNSLTDVKLEKIHPLDFTGSRGLDSSEISRLKAAADLLIDFGISEQAYDIYLELKNQDYVKELTSFPLSNDRNVSAKLARCFLTNMDLELCEIEAFRELGGIILCKEFV
jgi:hypothetical protein